VNVERTKIPDVLILTPRVFGDARGHFFESYNKRTLEQVGLPDAFVQDNQSRSQKNVIRGLHYQIRQPQGKLVRVVSGAIWDVVVDVLLCSPTFGQWVASVLSAEDKKQIWVPVGFAHGFLTLSETADVLYKTTDFYAPEHERCIIWSDPRIGIEWPLTGEPIVSGKDRAGKRLEEAEVFD